MHRAIEPHPHHLCQAARIVAVRLVDLRLQHGPHVPRLNADHRQARFGENTVKPLRYRSGFQSNSLEAIDGVRQHLQEGFRLTRHPRFPHDLARIIHDADARFLDRHIESSKIGHAALLLLMLEAADATSFHHQPGAQHPNFQLSTSWQADYPISLGTKRPIRDVRSMSALRGRSGPDMLSPSSSESDPFSDISKHAAKPAPRAGRCLSVARARAEEAPAPSVRNNHRR